MNATVWQYRVCYGIADRITFCNGVWQGADVPEADRKAEDILTCPLMWEFLMEAGADGWELVSVLETPAAKGTAVRTYFLKRSAA